MLDDKTDITSGQASFSAMVDGTEEDYQKISKAFGEFSKTLPDRVMDHLKMLQGDFGGFAIDRYEHSLQTATRAHKDGRDEEYVVCALLHDIGDLLGSFNHAELAATILKPFISEKNYFMLQNHAVFQGYYFFHHIGLDRDARDAFKEHEHFEYTAQFCHLYDQSSFDPEYESLPLETFEPMVRKLMEKPRASIYMKKDGTSIL
ncbi:MAG: HD domain-containing protein [Rhodobiaceae bacterium]|jgi:predicted HD phosphohydrolase|nr:HD domain-containing protein [Rhodobiaceae bacterium]MBT5518377.1 HD domain-containing protein [Rhodobiaceae bacterium]MBT7279716.1 HD domain-containing protein [Rhodobiaceae bacterium]MDG2495803.1 HD domain-containing protein [Alphaproteobacteria bacterium]